ncbi:uncharacterized protein LOC119066221 [Bradysia coprophila]|uniref:uncharacterized protein LOC119066221 n=1 Tax=Bradysia coprophila TaxID=38358 RepID=UPI00187D9869|nr:uncharacterized protein LOC119066221 [Bradysia coprophila]
MNPTEMPATFEDATSNIPKKKVKTKEKKVKVPDPSVKALKRIQADVRRELINCEPGDELETLVQTLQHNAHGQQAKKDVLAAFRAYYPSGIFKDDQLHLFGSTVMGLAFKDSDLDFYVELPNCEQHRSKKAQLKVIRNILESSKEFANFESITKPRVPIIKCIHLGTPTNCDFNCSNRFGSLNSPIVAHLLNFDHRIHKLAIIIKYWTKIHDCAGVNRISNYAVVWMLLYYLQTLPQPIVPPIHVFQRDVPPSMVSHYNFAFDYSIPNQTENQNQWPELLLGFFKFYRDFDYDSQLICPLYGKTFSKTDVKAKKVIELQRYERILSTDRTEKPIRLDRKALCIQDPFEITRKVPGDISIKNFRKIVSKIGRAAEIVECELEKGDIKSLFLQIFDVAKFDQYVKQKFIQEELERRSNVANESKEKKMIKQHRKVVQQTIDTERNECSSMPNISIASIVPGNEDLGKITLQLKPTDFVLNKIDKHKIQRKWAKEVIEMIGDVARDIFCLDLHDKASDEFAKKFDLVGARNVFLNRNTESCAKTWNEEVIDSTDRFNQPSEIIPLSISVEITADVNFDYVSVEFNDEIKAKTNNFYGIFCAHFVEHIDYFLKIYSVRRNKTVKSNIANASRATVKMTTKPAAQHLSKLSIPPIVSQNSQSSTTTLQLKPNEFTLAMVRGVLLKNDKCSNGAARSESVQELWAREVIKMIADILSVIFRFELQNDISHAYLRRFDLTGMGDASDRIFLRRSQKKSVGADTWIDEMRDSSNRFNSKSLLDVPLKVSAKIVADTENFDFVSIEFIDQIKTKKRNFYRIFCRHFIDRIDYFLKVYFVHRNEMAKSATGNSNPAQMKPTPESTTLEKSTSALPSSTTIVSQNAQHPKDTLQLEPTKRMLFVIRDMLSKSVNGVDNVSVKQHWAETVIEFTAQILSDIFKLGVHPKTHDRFQKMFTVSGACDVFFARKQQKLIDGNTLHLELHETMYRFVCFTKPMVMFAKISTDVKNFNSVSIEFSDELRTCDDNFYKTFCQQFKDNIDYLLDVYFVHRHEMILMSDTLQCKFVKYEPPSDFL